jgi:hypothetical protein
MYRLNSQGTKHKSAYPLVVSIASARIDLEAVFKTVCGTEAAVELTGVSQDRWFSEPTPPWTSAQRRIALCRRYSQRVLKTASRSIIEIESTVHCLGPDNHITIGPAIHDIFVHLLPGHIQMLGKAQLDIVIIHPGVYPQSLRIHVIGVACKPYMYHIKPPNKLT